MKNSQALVLLSSIKLAIATFISRILGLVRELLIARFFGASGLTDAFYVAYRIPNLLRDLFAEGGFSAAFVPIFTEAKIDSDEKVKFQLFRSAFWSLFLITSFFSILIFFSAENLVTWFAPSFLNDPEKFMLTVNMAKLVAPFLLFISLASLLMGILNTHNIFFLPAVTPAFLNLAVILSILYLTRYFEEQNLPGIYSVAVGILAGGFLQFAIQVPPTAKLGFKFVPTAILLTPKVKKILKKMGPGLIGFSANQINLLVNTILATSSGIGAVSWLNYGFRIFQFPAGVFGVSLGSSHLVYFADAWKKNQKKKAKSIFQSTLLVSLALLVPIASITIFYSDWIISILFEGGKFTRIDTFKTALALSFYAIAIPLEGIKKITTPLFYAIDKEKIQVIISLIAILFNIVFAYSFVEEYGFATLALSMSLSALLNVLLQLGILRRQLNFSWNFIINFRVFKIFFLGGLLPWATSIAFKDPSFFQYPKWQQLTLFTFLSALVLIFYSVSLALLGEKEILKKLFSKFKK